MEKNQFMIEQYFPIQSQTSHSDKEFLLNARNLVKNYIDKYAYLEVGSYLGGSLTPFLMDPSCTAVYAVDERGRQIPDERGLDIDYSGITNQAMIDKLREHAISIDKLNAFDGSIEKLQTDQKVDLAFIDGEHTDLACFRDFIWTFSMMNRHSVIMFHDSTLIYKSLRIIQIYLDSCKIHFKFMKSSGSAMSAILLGEFANVDIAAVFGDLENPEDFYISAETMLIGEMLRNRAHVQFSLQVNPVNKIMRGY